jgi:predicted esterase
MLLAALALLAGCAGADAEELRSEPLSVGGREHRIVDPGGPRRPLLVLLHGRGMEPKDLLWEELYAELERLGDRAPALLLVDGGESSYYHDRRDFAWGTHTLATVEAAERELETNGRIAIGGISMGGFGALDLGATAPVLRGGRTFAGALPQRRGDPGRRFRRRRGLRAT